MGFLGSSHQFGQSHVVHFHESVDSSESRALDAAFDGTQLCSIDPKFLVNFELRQASFVSNLTQNTSQGPFGT
jgi:hypothetical protein